MTRHLALGSSRVTPGGYTIAAPLAMTALGGLRNSSGSFGGSAPGTTLALSAMCAR